MPPVAIQVVKDPVRPIACHAWNGDNSMLALSPNDHTVQIYSVKGDKVELVHELNEHSQFVTSIDWCGSTNRLVTCGQDRNAYVWEFDSGKKVWIPQLVILRINRAATCVRWSPNGQKFAVGSGARSISVCYFDEENGFWVSKHIKKPIRSTILSLDWHPNNVLLAAGGCDFKCRIFSGYVKSVDKKPPPNCWADKMKFGDMMAEFTSGGWVHDISFSSDGNRLAFVGHDSSMNVVNGETKDNVDRFLSPDLPYLALTWTSPEHIVTAGHGAAPILYRYVPGSITREGLLDAMTKKQATKKFAALAAFKQMDSKGTSGGETVNVTLNSVHQNSIKELSILEGSKEGTVKFSTVGVDGQLVIWNMEESKANLSTSSA